MADSAWREHAIGYSWLMSSSPSVPAAVPGAPTPLLRRLVAVLRGAGLLPAADIVRRFRLTQQEAADNAAFLAENPDFVAPPLEQVYEVTGRPSLRRFAESGRSACAALAAVADAHLEAPPRRILDWGVGPARMARWWSMLRSGVEVHGGDPWPDAIAWGRQALPEVRFHHLPELPPTALEAGLFDLIYGVSILTHLRLDSQRAWLAELRRLLRRGGLLALTLQGEGALSRLSTEEQHRWRAGELVERAQVREGSRLFLSYHPPSFLRDDLFRDWEVVAHEPASPVAVGGQDLWLLR
jgi:SAM-dependent methyltransferase